MKDSEEWIAEIESKIVELKNKGRTSYYNISASMTKATATKIELHFSIGDVYTVEIIKCNQCTNKYDIIIMWSN